MPLKHFASKGTMSDGFVPTLQAALILKFYQWLKPKIAFF